MVTADLSYEISQTEDAGRAVFAHTDLPVGAHVLTTSADLSPIAHVIFRPYRKEVCAQCFAYDRGREWSVRDMEAGIAFCSNTCQETWTSRHNGSIYDAFRSVERLIRSAHSRSKHETYDHDAKSVSNVSSEEVVDDAWREAKRRGVEAVLARTASTPSKKQKGVLRKLSELQPDADILTYVLSGVVYAYKNHTVESEYDPERVLDIETVVPALYELELDPKVFFTTSEVASGLEDYIASYLVLLAILPLQLLPYTNVEYIINLATRASRNAFSIRPEGISDGEQSGEYLGWGVWPEASYFNHSCQPNVRKLRAKRIWSFYAKSAVQAGQQLCISYLGGDECDMDVTERRRKLQATWGFRCACNLCISQSSE